MIIPKEYTEEQLKEFNEKFGGEFEGLNFSFEASYNLFGQRAMMKVTKRCRNIPGFAPEYYTSAVCEIVINNFKGDSFYFQFHDSPPTMRENDWKNILYKIDEFRNSLK